MELDMEQDRQPQDTQGGAGHRPPRITVNRLVSLFYPPLGLLQARIDNISDSGIFIHLDNIRLNLYSDAEILEYIDDTLKPVRVTVVRVSEHGAGLHFVEPDPLQVERLRTSPPFLSAANDEA